MVDAREPRFKIGDRVRWTGSGVYTAGSREPFTIAYHWNGGGPSGWAAFPPLGRCGYWEKDLELEEGPW